jgi:uncharacterized membrane protein YagU involved in acid resistance
VQLLHITKIIIIAIVYCIISKTNSQDYGIISDGCWSS